MEEERPFKASRRFSREKALEAFRFIAPHKREYLLEAKAYRSTIQYASVWRQWTGYADKAGHPPMPATPEQLEAWVWYLIETKRMSPGRSTAISRRSPRCIATTATPSTGPCSSSR